MRTTTLRMLLIAFWVANHLYAGVASALFVEEFPGVDSGPLTAGPGGNVWYLDFNGDDPLTGIGKITPSGVVTLFPDDVGSDITSGPDGNIWYLVNDLFGPIRKITPSGVVTEFQIPNFEQYPAFPMGITTGPDGNLWVTLADYPLTNDRILRVTPSGVITEFASGSHPGDITAGPDGNLWFTLADESGSNGRIGRITPGGTITEFPLPTSETAPWRITAGPDGNVWFTIISELGSNDAIGRITPGGTITEFPVSFPSTVNFVRAGIAAGTDGNLWFTGGITNGAYFGRITPSGVITEFPLPRSDSPAAEITAGPDGYMWLSLSGAIARFDPLCGNGNLDAGEQCDDGNQVNGDMCDNNCTVPVCGNRIATPSTGEQCDDGNTINGDCCSSTCQFEASGSPCTSSNPCAFDSCDGAGSCGELPTGCKQAGKSLIQIKYNETSPSKNKLIWKWLQGDGTAPSELGDPATSTDYALCFYAGLPLATTINIPAGSSWEASGTTGFRYRNPTGSPDGVQKAILKSGVSGKAKAIVKGIGLTVPDNLQPSLNTPMSVQLVNHSDKTCFEAIYNDPIKNDSNHFKAKTP